MQCVLGIGSNRGDRHGFITQAAHHLRQDPDVHLLAEAPRRETAPVGGPAGQGPFVNTAWLVETNLGHHQLLYRLQAIERACGRTRVCHWGPRTLDIDILMDNRTSQIDTPALSLPHPFMAERIFVLQPLVDLVPEWVHAASGQTVLELYQSYCETVE